MRTTRRFFLASLAGVLLLLGILALEKEPLPQPLGDRSATPPARPNGFLGIGGMASGHNPFVNGRQVGIGDAESQVGFPVVLPQAATASRSNLETTWVETPPPPDESQTRVALYFSSDILVIETPNNSGMEPGEYFAGIVESMGFPESYLRNIAGSPALILPANAPEDVTHSNPPSVQFAQGRILISVYGPNSMQVAELVQVAESMDSAAPA